MAIATTSITEDAINGGGTWKDYGTGGGSVSNTDVFFTSTGSRARKVSNGIKGFAFDLGAGGTDVSADVVWIRWATLAGVGQLNTRTAGGVKIVVEDTSGNESYWYVDGNDTYGGGWKVTGVDMGNSPSANNGTAATLTLARYIGIIWDETASVGGGDPNCYIDMILRTPSAGITITGNSTSTLDDLVDTIDTGITGGVGNYGIFERRAGVVFSKARVVFSPDVTGMSDTDTSYTMENPVYDAGATIDSAFAELGVECSDSDSISFTRCGLTVAEPDETVTTDANREFDFTSASDATFTNCTLAGYDGTVMHLGGSGNTYTGVNFAGCSEILQTGAVISESSFRAAADAAGAYQYDENSDISDCQFFSDGTGHGIHFTHNSGTDLTGVSAIDLDNITFDSYGATDTADAGIDMNPDTASINVDFNVLNGGTVTTLDTRSPYTGTATIKATVTVAVTAQESDGTKIENARVRLEADAGGDLPSDDSVTIATSGTTATVTHTAHGLATNDYVIIRGANESELTGRNQITVTGVNTYTYTITSIAGAPGTGTITSTYSILSAFTSAAGLVQDTGFSFTNNQPVRGAVRKGTASTFYKQSPLTGTITTAGLALTAVMTPDE